jgi:hypothetical protein
MQRSLAVVICLLLLQHVGYIAAAATCSEDGMCSGGNEAASKTFVPSSLFFFRSGSPHHLTIRNRAKSSDSGTQGIWYVGQCASKVLCSIVLGIQPTRIYSTEMLSFNGCHEYLSIVFL